MPFLNPEQELSKGRVPVIHPTVMFNRKNLGNDLEYDERILRAEDLDLWFSLETNMFSQTFHTRR